MKSKIGKILIPVLVLSLIFGIALIWHFIESAEARPVSGTMSAKLGTYSGAGALQGDNIKASLDLVHTDLDVGLEDFEDILALQGLGTGIVIYVDNSAAGGETNGTTWTDAVLSIDAAITLCTADAGDIILVAAGHVEDLGTTDPDFDEAGVTIIGLGTGEQRPVLSFDTSTDIFTINADDIAVYNLVFLAHTPDVAKGIDITAGSENTIISGCTFTVDNAGTDEFLIAINVGADADNLLVENCQFYMAGGNAAEAILFDGTCDYPRIVGNEIFGDYSTACIYGDATGAAVHLVIKDNILYNGDDTGGLNAQPAIELKSDTSGIISDNMIACNVDNPELSNVAAACYVFGNKYTETTGVTAPLDIGLEVGKVYTRQKTSDMTGATDQLFTVAGGAIEIISLFGQITVVIADTPGSMAIQINATAGTGEYDAIFTTVVSITNGLLGDVIVFTDTVDTAVLTPTANKNVGQNLSWFCPAGEIEQTLTGTGTGNILWYMTFRPLDSGVTVTVD